MILTLEGRIAKIGEGKYTSDGTPVIDFQLAVDRGNTKKRVALINGKEYDADFYKVSVFGQSAISFLQYASVGREVAVGGRFLQEEYLASNQTIQIATDNPLYGYFKSLVGQVSTDVLSYDQAGNLYVKGNHPVNRTTMTAMEIRWKGANPNKAQGFGGGFQPQNNNFVNQGFANAQQGFPAQPQGFGGAPAQNFGTQPPAQGFGMQPPATGFGAQPSAPTTGFGMQPQAPAPQGGFGFQAPQAPAQNPMAGFTGQTNPTGTQGFAGFGAPSAPPTNFGTMPQNNGFGANPSAEQATQGFQAPTPQAPTQGGFVPPAQPVAQPPVEPQAPTTGTETNIPAPTGTETKSEGQVANQGF